MAEKAALGQQVEDVDAVDQRRHDQHRRPGAAARVVEEPGGALLPQRRRLGAGRGDRGGGDRLRARQGRLGARAQARGRARRRPVTTRRGDFVGEGPQALASRSRAASRSSRTATRRASSATPRRARQMRRQRARREPARPGLPRRDQCGRGTAGRPTRHAAARAGQSDSAANFPPQCQTAAREVGRRPSAAIYSDVTMVPMSPSRKLAARRPPRV